MKQIYRLLSILVGLVLLSSASLDCNPPESVISTSTSPSPASTSTKIPVTPTLAILTTPTSTTTVAPTASPTFVPTKTPKPRQAIFQPISTSISPDGEWEADVVFDGNQLVMRVFNLVGETYRWKIDSKIDSPLMYHPRPFAWSKDGKSLYFTHDRQFLDGCYGEWAFNGSDLHKLDLASGESSQITPKKGHWLALSPDETRLAYLDDDRIGIMDLESGASREAEVGKKDNEEPVIYGLTLHIVWSPDGKSLLIGLLTNVCEGEDVDKYTLIIVNAQTLEQEILIENSDNWLQPIEWQEAEQVLIQDENDSYWWLNPFTRKLEEKER